MKTADWFGRILCGVAMCFLHYFPEWFSGAAHNSIAWVAKYMVIAAISNAAVVVLASYLIRGSASYDLQLLAFCAVIVNLVSFIAFAAKNSPMVSLLNQAIMVISVAQFVRLIWPSNGSLLDYCRSSVLHRFADLSASSIHIKKETS